MTDTSKYQIRVFERGGYWVCKVTRFAVHPWEPYARCIAGAGYFKREDAVRAAVSLARNWRRTMQTTGGF